jgi:hypothetical protein
MAQIVEVLENYRNKAKNYRLGNLREVLQKYAFTFFIRFEKELKGYFSNVKNVKTKYIINI